MTIINNPNLIITDYKYAFVNDELDSLNERYSKDILIKLLDEKEAVPISKLHKYSKNYYAFKNVIKKLEEDGLVKTEEKVMGRKTIYVSLTEKGRAVAEKLKEAEEVARMSPEELKEQRKRIHWIVDINTYEDHITAYDIHQGKKESFNIWIKPNGKYLLLYCDRCHSFDCYHVDWAVHDPVIGSEIRKMAEKKGLKIKYLEDKEG